jgi:hypothetical protein
MFWCRPYCVVAIGPRQTLNCALQRAALPFPCCLLASLVMTFAWRRRGWSFALYSQAGTVYDGLDANDYPHHPKGRRPNNRGPFGIFLGLIFPSKATG